MLGNVKVSEAPSRPKGGRNSWAYPPYPQHRRPSLAQRIEERIARALNPVTDAWNPVFPFPLSGPLARLPDDRETGRKAFALVKRAFGLTTLELSKYFGLNWRTLQKWEQGRNPIDPKAWTLIQLIVRSPEARQLLTLQADG